MTEIDTPALERNSDATASELSRDQVNELADNWMALQTTGKIFSQLEPVPSEIAGEIAVRAQKAMKDIEEDGIIDEEYAGWQRLRNQSVDSAVTLSFELVTLAVRDWPFQAQINALHDKFKSVSGAEIEAYVAGDEYKALYVRDIIADNAPHLLSDNIKTILDESRPLWMRSSLYASILLRNKIGRASQIPVKSVPVALPIADRTDFAEEDRTTLKTLAEMSSEELALYTTVNAADAIDTRGLVSFGDLNQNAKEAVLTRRLFELSARSSDPEAKSLAGNRNRVLQGRELLQSGDLVHATKPEVFKEILAHGLRCGEAVIDNKRSIIQYPFTVSFLEVDEAIAMLPTAKTRFDALKNTSYGAFNLVLGRDESSTDHGIEQVAGVPNQRQILGGVPATEIKSLIVRDQESGARTQNLINEAKYMICENGFYIPVYDSEGNCVFGFDEFSTFLEELR